VARFRKLRPGPVGLAFAMYDVWRRLSPKQRRQLMSLAREHGPKVAARVAKSRRARRGA
jgi:hypothetical protein